jgi:ABC-2 type transport system ATP-binding protein
MNNLLEVRGLYKKYPTFSLEDVSFDVPAGYITGFIGPNGAGKTTTIKSILGITRPDHGEIRLFGQTARPGMGTGAIGVVMDNPLYPEIWTVREVESAIAPLYQNWNHEMYASYLKRFAIDGKKKVQDLSRGMKVKIQMAAALSHDAKLLILDEPTSGLDPVARDETCDILRDFIQEESKSVLFSTHITSDLEKTADYITFILEGRIAFTGTKEALMEKYLRIAGGIGELTPQQKSHIIGYREHAAGFEGMVEASDRHLFGSRTMLEAISLEEIIIFRNKGVKLHE